MPLYQYKCNDCETIDEENRPMDKANNIAICPRCARPMHKILSHCMFNMSNWGYNELPVGTSSLDRAATIKQNVKEYDEGRAGNNPSNPKEGRTKLIEHW